MTLEVGGGDVINVTPGCLCGHAYGHCATVERRLEVGRHDGWCTANQWEQTFKGADAGGPSLSGVERILSSGEAENHFPVNPPERHPQ